MSTNLKHDTIMVDRSLVYSLTAKQYKTASSLRTLVSQYRVVAYESAGASALERDLRSNCDLVAKRLSVGTKDLKTMSSASKGRLRAMLKELQHEPTINAIVAEYAWSTGSVRYDPEEVLSYIVRLLLFCTGCQADLACSVERWRLLRGVYEFVVGEDVCVDVNERRFGMNAAKFLQFDSPAECTEVVAYGREGHDGARDEHSQSVVNENGSATPKIFVSYRRSDEAGFAHALFQWLEISFGKKSVFMDVEGGICPGENFVVALNRNIQECSVVLVIIGKRWLEELVLREKDSRQDFVAIEVKSALELGKEVIPVLIGDVQMPSTSVLPTGIQGLASRHAVVLRAERFRSDCDSLIAHLRRVV